MMSSPAGFQAAMQTADDVDWFRFRALAGTSYTIRTEILTLPDSRLRGYEAGGSTLILESDDVDPGTDASSLVSVFFATTRYVTVEVSGVGGATGSCRLIVE